MGMKVMKDISELNNIKCWRLNNIQKVVSLTN